MDITPGEKVVRPKQTSTNLENFMRMLEGIHFNFPSYKHDHPPVLNVNEVADDHMTVGQEVADKVAGTMGSWKFIIAQATIMAVWIMLNLVAWFYHWDIYPFVLLNLAMSAQAAFATPLIMMSQNRQSEKDRLNAQNDYLINCKGEEEVRHIMEHLDHQDTLILQIVKRLEEQHQDILGHLSQLDPMLAERLGVDAVKISQNLRNEGGEITANS